MKSLFLVMVFSVTALFAFAQYPKTFKPSPLLDTIPVEVHERLTQRLIVDKARVTAKGKQGDYIKSLYDHRFEYVVDGFNEDYFIADHPLTSMLRRIADRIYDANPTLARELTVYTYRSGVPNAVSFGEGTIAIMLGLIERLETEDQVAFILCHEFAHYYAQHAERNFAEMAALNYDKELKRKISEIKRGPYGTYGKLKALFNSLDLSLSRHNRRSEMEADSLGLVYYLRTGYERQAPLRVMQILQGADKGLYSDNIDFRKHFSFEAFPFKESWIAYEKSNIIYASLNDDQTDTLKTHPNTRKRFERLRLQLGITELDSAALKHGKPITALSELASFEVISSYYHFKQYGKALFYSLLLTEIFPSDPYPRAIVAKSLYQLHKSQKEHNLDEVLELPDPRFDENYNRFLHFVNNLRLHELANLAYEYVTHQPADFYSDEEFIHALWQCSRFQFSKMDDEKVGAEYERLFPNGKYLSEMKNQK